MVARLLPWVVLLGLVAAWTVRASADNRAGDPPGYADAVAQGLNELAAGNYPEALEELGRAHAIYPNARTLRGLGMVEFELRDYVSCVRHLEQALASAERPLAGQLRSETQELLARAQRYVGELQLELDPVTATVSIDGAKVALGPEGSVLLEVGNHVLEVTATGRSSEKRSLRIAGGAVTDLRIQLSGFSPAGASPAEGSRALDPPHDGAPSAQTATYKKWWIWTTVAVVVVGGATVAALLLTRKSSNETRAVQGVNATGPTLQSLARF